jgi:hypothetical protein
LATALGIAEGVIVRVVDPPIVTVVPVAAPDKTNGDVLPWPSVKLVRLNACVPEFDTVNVCAVPVEPQLTKPLWVTSVAVGFDPK